MDSSSSQVHFYNSDGVDKLNIQYSGSGEFLDGVHVLIESSGFHMNKLQSSPTTAIEEIYLTDPNDFVILETDDCNNICENGRYEFDRNIRQTGWFEFQGKIFSLIFGIFIFQAIICQQNFEIISIFTKGRQVDKIRIDYNGHVEVYSPFEPYDLTFTGYDLSMTKEEPNGTVIKYSNYLRDFKFNRFVSLLN